jgi:hypothetical protein
VHNRRCRWIKSLWQATKLSSGAGHNFFDLTSSRADLGAGTGTNDTVISSPVLVSTFMIVSDLGTMPQKLSVETSSI